LIVYNKIALHYEDLKTWNESLIGIGNYEKLLDISVASKNMERFAQFEFEDVSI
jgi:hypothetical protein